MRNRPHTLRLALPAGSQHLERRVLSMYAKNIETAAKADCDAGRRAALELARVKRGLREIAGEQRARAFAGPLGRLP